MPVLTFERLNMNVEQIEFGRWKSLNTSSFPKILEEVISAIAERQENLLKYEWHALR